MSLLRRPKPGEDDLEEMMRQFEKQKPSASSVDKRLIDNLEEGIKKQKSLFSQGRAKDTEDNVEKANLKTNSPLSEEEHTKFENSCYNDIILNEIVEKNTSGEVYVSSPSFAVHTDTFKKYFDVMKIYNREPNLTTHSVGKKKSVFSQQLKQMKRETTEIR